MTSFLASMVAFLKGGTSVKRGTIIMEEIGSGNSLRKAVEGLEADIKRFVDSGPNLMKETVQLQVNFMDLDGFRPAFVPFDPTGCEGYN